MQIAHTAVARIWRLLCLTCIFFALPLWADVTPSYYSSLNGKKDDALRVALTQLLYEKHTTFVKYNWDFPMDYDSEGNMLDIYSDCGFNQNNDYPSSYKCCCDAVNREHVVCQSSFGGSESENEIPQYSDRHHLYPVDGRANGHRSDLPFGECSGGSHGSCSKSSVIYPDEGTETCALHEYGKSGKSTFKEVAISGNVYEVGDEYKGDIARAILYMVVRYATTEYCRLPDGAKNAKDALKTPNAYPVTAWANTTVNKVGQMFSTSLSPYYGLSEYGKAILLKWHRQDPVSPKEIARNNGVEAAQGNRNPFVDYPCLVEYLWGDHTGEEVDIDALVGSFDEAFTGDGCTSEQVPSISRPVGSVDLGTTSANQPISKTVTVQGANLTAGLTLAVTGADAAFFTLSVSSLTKAAATDGTNVTVTYTPTAAGSHSVTLAISGGGLSKTHTVALSGACCNQYMLTLSRNNLTEEVNGCGTYELPTEEPALCNEWPFQGWSTSSAYESTTAPDFTTETNEAMTLYAVYGRTELAETDTMIVMKDVENIAGTVGSFTLDTVGSRGTRPTYNTNNYDGRLYAKNQYTISSENTLHRIVFYLSKQGLTRLAPVTASVGTIATQALGDKTVTWTGEANSVTFTVGDQANYGTDGSSKAGQLDFDSIAIQYTRSTTTYKTHPCATYTLAYADEDGVAAGGQYAASATVALPGTVIFVEAEPNDGYTFNGWTLTKADDEQTTLAVTDGQFTMPEYNVRLAASFSVPATYSADWMANGTLFASQTGLVNGETPDMPNKPADFSTQRVFVGWTTQAAYQNSTEAPSDLFTTVAPAINSEDAVFYAVYADAQIVPGGTEIYAKVTATENITDGQYLIVYETKNVAFDGSLTTLDATVNTIDVDIDDAQIALTSATAASEFTLSTSEGTLKSKSGFYIGRSSYNNGLETSPSTQYQNVFSINSNDFICKGSGTDGALYVYLNFNSAKDQMRFRYYKNASQKAIQLYKRTAAMEYAYSNYATTNSAVPTAIEDTEAVTEPGECTKMLRNGNLYILRGSQLYTPQGQRVN